MKKQFIISKMFLVEEESPVSFVSEGIEVLFIVFFNFGYYLLITPFRIVKTFNDKSQPTYKLHTSKLQQILCVISHTLLLFQYFSESRTFFLANKWTTVRPAKYFDACGTLAKFFYKVFIVIVAWKDRDKFVKLANFIAQSSRLYIFKNQNIKFLKGFIYTFCTCITINATTDVIAQVIIINEGISMDWIFRRFVAVGRYNFFLAEKNDKSIAPTWNEITEFDIFLGFLTSLGICFRQRMSYLSDGIILVMSIVLSVAGKAFKKLVEENHQKNNMYDDPSVILRNFSAIKTLSLQVNSVMSKIVLMFIGEYLFYYSAHFNDILEVSDFMMSFRKLIFLLNICASLYFSGDCCKGVEDSMLSWISSVTEAGMSNILFSRGRVAILISEAKSHIVGISGGIFVLDYSAIFNFLATVITYWVVCSTSGGS
ncbi:hypothetical protein Fcan01_20530 [Folsomia candida]|uniref:Gustatory receptor n=1 Tax=Folsomia candida TaxID=158441 RepID=A0A226DHI6_FOLCA|nr:hypothetical protein Fcan01_20530 [Folsomia candida]